MKTRNVVLFIASSIDGYIATQDESLEWLFRVKGEGDNGYSVFYETIDTVLMGRRTYHWILRRVQDGFPYESKECYVFTRSTFKDTKHVTFVKEDIPGFVNRLKQQEGKKNIWLVGGGELARFFLQEKLIDEIILTLAPTILGKGISLVKEADLSLDLWLKEVKRFHQFVQLHYLCKK